MEETAKTYYQKSNSVKKRFLKMYVDANAGHVGSSLSCADLLTFVKLFWMKLGDDLILSKGHAAACLYSVLVESGEISEADIETFYKDGTFFAAHPPPNKIKGIRFATGSLGHGLSIAAGLAHAYKLKKKTGHIFCVTSDGELNEGSIWEAALYAAGHSLDNMIWIIDRNRLQGFGATEDVMPLEPLDSKIRSFGWDCHIVDGHSYEDLVELKKNLLGDKVGRPQAIIANTVKGKGTPVVENKVDCHYLPLTSEQYKALVGKLVEE